MAKYNDDIVKDIAEYIETGEYLIKDICKKVGISTSVYYEWKETKSEFLDAIKKAEKEQLKKVKLLARKGLNKLLTGDTVTEVTMELKKVDGTEELVETKRVRKKIQPNVTAVIFSLKNTDPDNFADKKEVEVTHKDLHVIKPVGSGTLDEILNDD